MQRTKIISIKRKNGSTTYCVCPSPLRGKCKGLIRGNPVFSQKGRKRELEKIGREVRL